MWEGGGERGREERRGREGEGKGEGRGTPLPCLFPAYTSLETSLAHTHVSPISSYHHMTESHAWYIQLALLTYTHM